MSDDPFDDLRRVLNSKAVAAANAIGLGAKIKLPNESYTPPKATSHCEFFFKTGGSKQAELGGGKAFEITVGIYEFNILVPENTADGPATQLAGQVRRMFNRKEWLVGAEGYVKLMVANVKTPFNGPINGYYRVCVDGVLHFYHRDPNPLPFNA